MQYDFDTVTDRRGTYASKWEVPEGELPMWVADMDFQTAPAVVRAVCGRAAHGIFGYTEVPDAWYEAVAGWWRERHGFPLERDWLLFTTGVIPAISSCVRKLTTPGENVLVQTPVYNIFFNSIRNNGRNVLESPLVYDGKAYRIDFDRLERDLADPQTSLMILCNPHNPVGKIWDRETLAAIGALCARYHVTVISDEIHCDLTDPGFAYVPFASVSETCRAISVTCLAPTKTFNLAGLQTAAVSVPDPVLRHKVWRALNTDEVAEPNAFAVTAAIAAYTEGADWLDSLRAYLFENKQTVRRFLSQEIPEIRAVPSEATYLLWLDCGALLAKGSGRTEPLDAFIRRTTGLYLSGGAQYGGNGADFVRLNAACPRALVLDGLARLKKAANAYTARA